MEYGIVGYTHAGGVDRPLVAYKVTGGNAGAEVIPHMNWRGLFSRGTNASGGTSTVAVEWPGFRTTAYHSMGQTQETTKNWMGSLLEGQRDAGGQMYMRNRYYDPATGQFTQTDPIGIAGGLNTYGFAGGDPVTYSDPYGLCKNKNGEGADAECPPEIIRVTTSTGSSGQYPSSVTVTTEYAPLTQEQVDYAINEKRERERGNDALGGAAVALIAARLGLGSTPAAGVGAAIGIMGSGSDWEYMPHVGDQITTSVTAGYGSSTNFQSYVVQRADGNTLRLTGSPWNP